MKRTVRNIAIGLSAFIVLVVAAALIVVQTNWFRNYVRQKIITATEEGTGGKVEIGSFNFEPSHLRATITDFVIHGNEPAGAAPFVRVKRVEVDLLLLTSIRHLLDVRYLAVDTPQANIMVFADGRTNVPSPKQKSTSNKTTLETVVDLAVGHFELTNGLVTFNESKQALDVRGNNLRAQLWYNLVSLGYTGRLQLEPLYVASGRNTPVNFAVDLPVTLERDRVIIKDGSVKSPASTLAVNGSIENLRNPKTAAHLTGRLALADLKNIGNLPLALNARDVPAYADLDANATVANDRIDVAGLRLGLGGSRIEASGTLKDPNGNGALDLRSHLALGEISRLAKLSQPLEGAADLNGHIKLNAKNDVAIQGMQLSALGAQFEGDASLANFERYKVNGTLHNLDLMTAARVAGQKIPYDGVVSGPIDVEGEMSKAPQAHAQLSIAPGRRGIPVSGKINADYAGDAIAVHNSYLALPHSRVELNGSLGNRLNISLTSRDLNDLLAAANLKEAPPVKIEPGGQATFNGALTGSLTAPRIAGHLAVTRFSVEGRGFNALGADVAAASTGATVNNGSLTRGQMQTAFNASVGLRKWSATPNQPLKADIALRNGDLADAVVLAGEPSAGYSGTLTADAHIAGTVGNPRGTAEVQAANGAIEGEAFDQADVRVNLQDQLVTIPAAYITSGPSRADLSGEFQHPRDSFTTGRVHAHVRTNQIDLARIQTLQKQQPNSSGTAQADVDVNGTLGKEFLLTSVNADVSARGLRLEGQPYGDLQASARTNGQTVNYTLTSNFAGSNIQGKGSTQLVTDYPTTADVSLANLPVERVLTVAKQSGIPARGLLSGTAHFQGTMQNPEGSADVTLARAVVYDEPLDRVHARVTYLAQSIDLPQLEVVSGPSRIDVTARFDHPAGNLQKGNVQFRVNSSRIDLARIRNAQKLRPGLGGVLQITANGAGSVQEKDPKVLFSSLNANVSATGLAAQGTNFGDLTLTANTAAGNRLDFALNSNLANSSIHGQGHAQLTGDYPVNAQVTFSNVAWTRVRALIGPTNGEPPSFEATTAGQVTVDGPVLNTDQLRGSLQLSSLQVSTIPRPGAGKPIVIQNQGPIALAMDRGTVRIETLHLTGPQTDIQGTGTVELKAQTLNVNVNANANLAVLQNLDRDLYAAGNIVLAAQVRGTTSKPLVNGRLELHNASAHYASVPNGIANANGVIQFNGNNARVQQLTAESGGGKITMSGFVGFFENVRFGLRANASNVRVRVQQGASIVVDSDIRLTGTTDVSTLSGTVTIDQVNYAPQSDIGSLLSRTAPPVQSPTAPSPVLEKMKLDIRVRTSPATTFQAALAQNLQADADLRVRGTAAQPGVLGRVTVNEGELVFFGSTYTVNSGTIGFYNPFRIEPVLDINLETRAKGVDVVLRVTGPIDDMKLSYTSDPPLQFQEIVGLLASGRTPTSDPTLLANQPSTPPQSFEQMGESAIVGKALADPVSNRLQRVFGVTQLKIDPSFTSGSDLPTAQLTLQQQVSNNITFTYVSALNDPNSTIIRAEWALNQQWSAVATRDQNGIFSINFFYKKQFR